MRMASRNWKWNPSPRFLVEGAILAAAAVLLFLGVQLPGIGIVSGLLCPLPLVVLTYRHRWQESASAAIIASLLTFIFTGNFLSLAVFLLQFGLLGVVLGEMFRRNYTFGKVVIVGSIFSLGATFFMFLFTLALSSKFPAFYDRATFEKITEPIMKRLQFLFSRSGNSEEVNRLKVMGERIRALIPLLLPSFLVLSALFEVSINYWVSRAILVRLGYRARKITPFSQWRVPESMVWGFIGGALLLLLLHRYRPLLIAGMNLTYFFSLIYLIQGVAILFYLTRRWRFPWYLKLVVLLFLGLEFPFIFFMIITLGIFDTWFDFRKLKRLSGSYPRV